jgi:hypothetical protein
MQAKLLNMAIQATKTPGPIDKGFPAEESE